MIHDVVAAEYRGGREIKLTFDDGKTGTVDFTRYLTKGGVFERFRDLEFFKRFKIDQQPGVLTWGDEIDIAPETLYAEATNSPLPEWMVRDAPATTETGQPSGEGSEWVMEPKCQEKVGKREVSRFPPLSRIECPNPSRPGRQTGYSPPGEASAVRNVPFFL